MDYLAAPLSQLRFDPENPRLPEHIDGRDEQSVLDWMLSDAGLVELMGSIAVKGFFPAEPLLVMRSPENEDEYWVLEGNRRLAATLLLTEPSRAPRRRRAVEDMANLGADVDLSTLPCAIFSDRYDVLDYLGYRHITGIKQWEPAAKARYLDSLYREHLQEHGPDVYRYIARLIGSRADYVMRLLGALRLYERMTSNADEPLTEDVSFSLITLSLNYRAIVTFLGLETLDQETFSYVDEANLDHLTKWLFQPNPELGRTQLGDSRNMKFLAAAVAHPEGVNALLRGETVEDAASATLDVSELFLRALRNSRDRLVTAQNLLHRVERTGDALAILDELEELLDQLRLLVRRRDRAGRHTDV
ncbi:ParB/Srx family N-terminal domain-containing protein [Nocardioides zeicaulis]|uniref:ParB/Srx family N-terminal domain-containing protein n=1 Tax=Nocardioides zeicaulis TaxID=1776857 RepID=A0ABV6DZE5_9ACTN